jgi:glycosyltransferase involved in cell wall biosynthesis
MVRSNNVVLKIFGSGPNSYVNKLFDMARGDKRIEFCGVYSEDHSEEILSNIDVTIVPSLWYENYPLVLHESLACNVPVVASNIGGMAEKIKDGINGFTFKVGDSASLKEILERIANNPQILNELKAKMDDLMIPTVEQEAYAYEREYRRVING